MSANDLKAKALAAASAARFAGLHETSNALILFADECTRGRGHLDLEDCTGAVAWCFDMSPRRRATQ